MQGPIRKFKLGVFHLEELLILFAEGVSRFCEDVDECVFVECREGGDHGQSSDHFGDHAVFDDVFGNDPGQIPSGTAVSSAALVLEVDNSGNPGDVYEVAVGWDESVMEEKFRWLAQYVLEDNQIDALLDTLWHFDELSDVRELTATLQGGS